MPKYTYTTFCSADQNAECANMRAFVGFNEYLHTYLNKQNAPY